MCVDTERKEPEDTFGLKPCEKNYKSKNTRTEQYFILTWHEDIRPKGRNVCWDVSSIDNKASVNLYKCHGMKGNQYWHYDSVWIYYNLFITYKNKLKNYFKINI